MSFNPIDTKVVIVVTNYLYNSIYDFERNEIYKKYNLQKITPNIISADGCIPPKEIQSLFPISEYIINSKNIYISYNDLQKTLSCKMNYNDKSSLLTMTNILYDFIDLKISDIASFGINFISNYKLTGKKLMILNQDIEKHIIDFNKNKSFQVTLLLQQDDCRATYKIRKISGGDETNEPRIYQIDTNMHFENHTTSTQEKINWIKDILNNIYDKYYATFTEKCNQILEMNHEEA